MNISSVSAVRSFQPTVQSTAKSENASTNRTTPGTAAYPHAHNADQALRGSLTITTVPTLATAALVGLSSLPVAGAQSVNQQIAAITGIANGLLNATATNAAQIEKLANITTVLTRLTAQNHEDNALTRRVGEDSATRAENALARTELIAGFALAVGAVILIPFVIKLINSAIRHFSPSTPMPLVPLNVATAAAGEDIEAGPNTSTGNGRWARQPFESRFVDVNLDSSSQSSHASNSGEEKASEGGSIHSSHASNSDEEKE